MNDSTEPIVEIGCRACAWIEENLGAFKVTDRDDDLALVRQIKPLAELALTCDLLLRSPNSDLLYPNARSFAHRILKFCWNELDGGEHLRRLILTYPDLYSLVTVYPPFFKAGLRDSRLEMGIEAVTHDRTVLAIEFPAWRLIDFSTALRALGFLSPWDEKKLLKLTWLGALPAPWSLSDSAAYSVTHVVFYLTDFGFKPNGLPVRHLRYLRRWAPVWSRYYARAANLDLLSEMLMVAFYIGAQEHVSGEVDHLSSQQLPSGLVPGPLPEEYLKAFGEQAEYRSFLANYHTTLVATMASLAGAARSFAHDESVSNQL